ncbi:hypothetical protein QTP88_021380 [Uroleucon formosanum]
MIPCSSPENYNITRQSLHSAQQKIRLFRRLKTQRECIITTELASKSHKKYDLLVVKDTNVVEDTSCTSTNINNGSSVVYDTPSLNAEEHMVDVIDGRRITPLIVVELRVNYEYTVTSLHRTFPSGTIARR